MTDSHLLRGLFCAFTFIATATMAGLFVAFAAAGRFWPAVLAGAVVVLGAVVLGMFRGE